MNSEKNLLDLQHSLYSAKGTILFSLGVGGAFTFFFGLKQITQEYTIPLLVALICLAIFGWFAIIQFHECNKIQNKIRKFLKTNFTHPKSPSLFFLFGLFPAK